MLWWDWRQAADDVKSQAMDAASSVADAASSTADSVKDTAEDAYSQVASKVPGQASALNLVYDDLPSVDDTGCCSAANPYVPVEIAPVVLVMNIFMPGVGTIVAAYYDA